MRLRILGAATLIILSCAPPESSQAPAPETMATLVGGTPIVADISTAPFHPGTNNATITIDNKSAAQSSFSVEIRSFPGLWLKPVIRRLDYKLEPGATETLNIAYEFEKVRPYARLRVRFGDRFETSGERKRLINVFHDEEIASPENVGVIDYRFEEYQQRAGDHVRLYVFDGTTASRDAENILSIREAAVLEIEEMLAINFTDVVHIALFETMEHKSEVTGHIGEGWAFGNVIVEVYNDEIKLDPYHELTHVIAGTISDHAPSFLDEGFAIYATETLGGDALEYLGAPGVKIDQAVLQYIDEGRYMALDELIGHDIGSVSDKAPAAYAEAGSFARFMLNTFGPEKFVEMYAKAAPLAAEGSTELNRALLESTYAVPLENLESAWLGSLG